MQTLPKRLQSSDAALRPSRSIRRQIECRSFGKCSERFNSIVARSTWDRMATSGANRGKRPRLVSLSEEMRHRSGLLAQELSRWPDVSMRPMFGLRAFYRGTVVFAMLPDKRALES